MSKLVPDFLIRDGKDGRLALVVLLQGWDPEKGGDAGLDRWMQKQLTDYLTENGCSTALLVLESKTYVLECVAADKGQHRLEVRGSEDTAILLPSSGMEKATCALLEDRVKRWLETLVASPEAVLAGQQDFLNALGTGTLEAVRGGTVVWEMIEECKRRRASKEPGYSSAQVQQLLRALEVEWERTGGFDQDHLDAFLARWRAEARG